MKQIQLKRKHPISALHILAHSMEMDRIESVLQLFFIHFVLFAIGMVLNDAAALIQ